MRNLMLASFAAIMLATSTGCGMCDCFLGHLCGHGGACDQCCDQGCDYCGPHCGACGCCGGGCSCPPGGCGPGGCGEGGCACGHGGHGHGGYAHGGYGPDCYAAGAPACSPHPDCYTKHAADADQLGGPAGPPSAQVTYPYYTTRGPRDFLAKNPPSIGP